MEAREFRKRVDLVVEEAERSGNWWRMQAAMQMVVGAGLEGEQATRLREAMRKSRKEEQQKERQRREAQREEAQTEAGKGAPRTGSMKENQHPNRQPQQTASAAKPEHAGSRDDPGRAPRCRARELEGDGFTLSGEDPGSAKVPGPAADGRPSPLPLRVRTLSVSMDEVAVDEARCRLFGFFGCGRAANTGCMAMSK